MEELLDPLYFFIIDDMTNPIFLVVVFIISALVGYKVIKNIPSLLHTPLMSGMNALSGVTAIGAILLIGMILKPTLLSVIASIADKPSWLILPVSIAGIGLVLAMINVVGGFAVTDRMLRMFNKKKGGKA